MTSVGGIEDGAMAMATANTITQGEHLSLLAGVAPFRVLWVR
jgi:hypothetical protein